MEEKSSLEKLKKRLYKEKDGDLSGRVQREEFSPSHKNVKDYWNKRSETVKDIKYRLGTMKKKSKFPYFWFFILLGIVALVFVGMFYFLGAGIFPGANVVSSRKIDLELEGPSLVNAGELNRWFINLTNNNEAGLELADIILKYPEGSLDTQGDILKEQRIPLGKIGAGENIKREISFFVMGAESEQREVEIILEYRLESSNAIFAKNEKKVIQLSRSPIGISLSAPEEVEAGREFTFDVEYVSNSEVVLKDLEIKIEYPPGFHFIGASPSPVNEKNEWEIGDLAPQEQRKLEIRGILEGQDLTELVFHVSVGRRDENDEFNVFNSEIASVFLQKPLLNLSLLINGKDVDVISSGNSLTVSIPWENKLPTEIRNAVISAKLEGEVVDFYTLSVSKGFYRSSDNTIVWNASSFPGLTSVAPGAKGQVQFSFALKDVFSVEKAEDKNFSFVINGEMTGTRITEGGASTDVKADVSKEIKVASRVQLVSSTLYYSGSFSNQGPIPPKVGEKTTYTVVWSVSNFYNDVSSATVRASLPSYVSWLGNVEPAEDEIAYDVATGEVVWSPGLIQAGTGILRPAKTISFQVAITPALNQIDEALILANSSTFEGKDLFTDVVLRTTANSLSTLSIPEAQFNSFLGRVTE